mgnify:CR=1 FL=1
MEKALKEKQLMDRIGKQKKKEERKQAETEVAQRGADGAHVGRRARAPKCKPHS